MPKIVHADGSHHDVDFQAEELFVEARRQGVTPVQYINRRFAEDVGANHALGTPFEQIMASMGIARPGFDNPFGLRSPTMAELIEGQYQGSANTSTSAAPFGSASRALSVISIINSIESQLAKDRTTDADTFYSLVSNRVSINSETFEQPVIEYRGVDGPESAKAARVAQNAHPPKMLFISTSDRIRKIGAWNIGLEWTHQALKATTLDFVSLTTARYLQVERDDRAYRYISSLWYGDVDFNIGAVPVVQSSSLDAASTGGVLTHEAWVLWLARNRKVRRITHVIMDIKTYLKVEKRTGRPGTNNYDPSLARIDPQARPLNDKQVGWGNDVKFIIVDPATEGGPVPANTILGLDATGSISLVTNPGMAYQGIEDYAMKRTTAMRMDWAEEVFRTFGDAELRLFDILQISN